MNVEESVLERYSDGARARVEALCCPVDYDSKLTAILPQEIIDKDYGCGDPSRYVHADDVVLDLGSGSGKVCYMAAQLVGPRGRVIGVDMNDDMLDLARRYQSEMAAKLAGDRVTFHKGHIQDLALDVAAMEEWLASNPVRDAGGLARLEQWKETQRRSRPLVGDDSIDVVISNCVLNLVHDDQKQQLVREVFRVVKPGGRIAISDIVSDEPVPGSMKQDTELWSGCVAGAFQESQFLGALAAAGFQGICLANWSASPWRVIGGIEFRSVTVTAVKPEGSECMDRGHAVIYRGPFSSTVDDDGHEFFRGERMAVCERTYRQLMRPPFSECFIGIEPVGHRDPVCWCAPKGTRRSAAETKGADHNAGNNSCC